MIKVELVCKVIDVVVIFVMLLGVNVRIEVMSEIFVSLEMIMVFKNIVVIKLIDEINLMMIMWLMLENMFLYILELIVVFRNICDIWLVCDGY